MNAQTPGQMACIAWNAAFGEQFGIIAADEWELGDPRGRAAWEAAAAAVETEQLREVRADRDRFKKRMLDLAAEYDEVDGHVPGSLYMAIRAEVLNAVSEQIKKGLDV